MKLKVRVKDGLWEYDELHLKTRMVFKNKIYDAEIDVTDTLNLELRGRKVVKLNIRTGDDPYFWLDMFSIIEIISNKLDPRLG